MGAGWGALTTTLSSSQRAPSAQHETSRHWQESAAVWGMMSGSRAVRSSPVLLATYFRMPIYLTGPPRSVHVGHQVIVAEEKGEGGAGPIVLDGDQGTARALGGNPHPG